MVIRSSRPTVVLFVCITAFFLSSSLTTTCLAQGYSSQVRVGYPNDFLEDGSFVETDFSRMPGEASEITIEYISSCLWSGDYDVVVDGNYAYCAFQSGLVILDISDPSNPDSVSSLYMPSGCSAVEKSGDYVFLACGSSGVTVVDVTNPSTPIVNNNILTLSYSSGLLIVDSILYSHQSGSGTASIELINISDPLNLSRIGTYPSPAYDIYVRDTLVFAAKQYGLLILNVADPSNPDSIGFTNENLSWGYAISVSDNFAYVVDYSAHGIVVYDITNPTSPAFIDSMYIGNYTRDIYTNDTIAIIASDHTKFMNISDPSNITEISHLSYNYSEHITAGNGMCYLSGTSSDMQIVDFSDVSSPIILSHYPDVHGFSYGIFANDTLAYLPSFTGGFQIIDVSDIYYPQLLGNLPPNAGWFREVIVENDIAYAVGYGGLSVIDVSDPNNPDMLSFLATDYDAINIFISDSLAFIAHRHGSDPADIIIVNIADPNNPDSIGSIHTPSYACNINVIDSLAYVADFDNGLYIFDISDLSNPIQTYNIPLLGQPTDILVDDNHIYFVTSYKTYIFDTSDPLGPVDTLAGGEEIYAQDSYVFLASFSGLITMMVHDTLNNIFQEVVSFKTPTYITDFFVVDSLIYVSGNSVSIFKYHEILADVDDDWDGISLANQYDLNQNYPNPFNPVTTIEYNVPRQSHITIAIFNILGQKIIELVDETKPAGEFQITWDGIDQFGSQAPTGIYLYRLQIGDFVKSKQMLLLK